MKLSEFDYHLPKELIAQNALEDRDRARLLVLDRKTGEIFHHTFFEIDKFFKKGDLLVINNTKVFKARLKGKKETGGTVEILLIKEFKKGIWEAMISHAKRTKEGTKIFLDKDIYDMVLYPCPIILSATLFRVMKNTIRLSLPKKQGQLRHLLLACISLKKQ
jgi:S-adenosylmethionine:tRNA ribosyltransferase-isomerase